MITNNQYLLPEVQMILIPVWSAGVVPPTFAAVKIKVRDVYRAQPFLCWWNGDLLRELLNGNRVNRYESNTPLVSANGCSSIDGTKSTPVPSANLSGDWREEVVFSYGGNLKIFTTTILTKHRLYTLMHDRQYRCAVVWQNVANKQPPHPGYFLGTSSRETR